MRRPTFPSVTAPTSAPQFRDIAPGPPLGSPGSGGGVHGPLDPSCCIGRSPSDRALVGIANSLLVTSRLICAGSVGVGWPEDLRPEPIVSSSDANNRFEHGDEEVV